MIIVHWSKKESSTLALGSTPIVIGRSSEAHVLLAEEDSPVPVMARIMLTDGIAWLADGRNGSTRPLRDGEILTYGRIRIEVRASGGEAAVNRSTAQQREASMGRARTAPEAAKVADPVERARAGKPKWYEVEVTTGTTRSRER